MVPSSFPRFDGFKYNPETKVLNVHFQDGAIIRYFDIQPTLAFLSPGNVRRNADFIAFLNQNPKIRAEIVEQGTSVGQEPGAALDQNGITPENRTLSREKTGGKIIAPTPEPPPVLPREWQYSPKTKTLEVTYVDSSRVRYFDVDKRAAFLHPDNIRSHADFLRIRHQYRSEPVIVRLRD